MAREGSSRRAVLQALAATGIGIVAGGTAHGYLYERYHVGVTRADLPVSGLPEPLDGLRIALLTDFHLTGPDAQAIIEHAIRLTRTERPDLIVFGGDFVTLKDRAFMTACADLLSALTAPHGVFAVLGNHDDDVEMPRALGRRGVTVLADEHTRVSIQNEALDLIGIRFWTRRTADVARLMKDVSGTPILLAHDPRRLEQAAALNVPLVLSGHTHGGQIVVPGVGAVGARKFPIAEGWMRKDNTTLFVSRGIGTIYVPCRINCAPEVALLTLRRLVARGVDAARAQSPATDAIVRVAHPDTVAHADTVAPSIATPSAD